MKRLKCPSSSFVFSSFKPEFLHYVRLDIGTNLLQVVSDSDNDGDETDALCDEVG